MAKKKQHGGPREGTGPKPIMEGARDIEARLGDEHFRILAKVMKARGCSRNEAIRWCIERAPV